MYEVLTVKFGVGKGVPMDRSNRRTQMLGLVLAFVPAIMSRAAFAQGGAGVLNGAIKAEHTHGIQSVLVQTASTISGKLTHLSVRLTENRAAQRFLMHAKSATVDRVYFVSGRKLLIFNPNLDQYLTRMMPTDQSIGPTLIQELSISPALELAIDPDAANQTVFRELRTVKDWSVSRAGGIVTLNHTVPGKAVIQMQFSASTGLPLVLQFVSGGKYDHTTLQYQSASSTVSFRPPRGACEVVAFGDRFGSPRFADAESAHVAKACLLAYDKLKSVQFKLTEGTDSTIITWQGLEASESGSRVAWAFDGRRLMIYDRARRVLYAGASRPEAITTYLDPLSVRIDPLLRELLNGENILGALYSPVLTARLAGRMTLGGHPYDLFELSGAGIRIQLRIRSDNHLIEEFMTEDLDRKGTVISRTDRSVEYLSVNKSLPQSTFRLTVPANAKPLSALSSR